MTVENHNTEVYTLYEVMMVIKTNSWRTWWLQQSLNKSVSVYWPSFLSHSR